MKTHNPYLAGVPDCWYSGKSGDLWIEYKFIVLPKRDSTVIHFDLTGLQHDWLMDRIAENRNVAVIVGCESGGVIFENGEWETPLPTSVFKNLIQSRKSLADYITMRCL